MGTDSDTDTDSDSNIEIGAHTDILCAMTQLITCHPRDHGYLQSISVAVQLVDKIDQMHPHNMAIEVITTRILTEVRTINDRVDDRLKGIRIDVITLGLTLIHRLVRDNQ